MPRAVGSPQRSQTLSSTWSVLHRATARNVCFLSGSRTTSCVSCQGLAKSLFLRMVERSAQHRAADPLQLRQDFVGGHLADQQKQGGVALLQCLRGVFHELIVDANIAYDPAERPA